MSGMIRLRPTQILLTSEEVSKALKKFHPVSLEFPSSSSSGKLPWDRSITRRHRNTRKAGKAARDFIIHEDPLVNGREADSGEMSEMSDFSFGPILFRRSLSDGNTLLAETNNDSEAGYEGSDDGQGSESTSWDGRHSVTTLTNNSPASGNFISSTLIDGSISSADEQQDLIWEVYSNGLTEHGSNSEKGESFVDIEYLADVELSVPEDSGSSTQGYYTEDHVQESYSLPVDGASEKGIRQEFKDMDIYASPISPPERDEGRVRSRGSPDGGTPGTPGTISGASLPPTPPSVRRLLEEVSPHLDDVAGLSPLHVAVSRVRLARYRSRSLQHSALTGRAGDLEEGDGHHQRFRTSGISQEWLFNSSPPLTHVKRRATTIGARPMSGEPYGTNTDDSDGGIEILEQVSGTGTDSGGKEDEIDGLDGEREDAARKLFG